MHAPAWETGRDAAKKRKGNLSSIPRPSHVQASNVILVSHVCRHSKLGGHQPRMHALQKRKALVEAGWDTTSMHAPPGWEKSNTPECMRRPDAKKEKIYIPGHIPCSARRKRRRRMV